MNNTLVRVLPFLHNINQEYQSRVSVHRRKAGCPTCKGEIYIDDLIPKTINIVSSLDEANKEKLRKHLNAKDDVFLVTKENGSIKKTQII